MRVGLATGPGHQGDEGVPVGIRPQRVGSAVEAEKGLHQNEVFEGHGRNHLWR